MSYDDLKHLKNQQLEHVLWPLRRAHARLDKIVRGQVKGVTEFGIYEASSKRQAIVVEMQRIEAEIRSRLSKGVEAMASGAAGLEAKRHAGIPFEVDASVIARAQQNAAAMVQQVTKGVKAQLNSAVVDALVGGSTREQFDARIREILGPDVLESRVERIARTELGEAYMQQQAANDEKLAATPGVDLIKRWVKSGKGPTRSRPEHDAIHGQERELEDLFGVGGGATAATPPGGGAHQATGPLDPMLPPEQRINCGCDVVRVPRSEAQQAYIQRTNPKGPPPDLAPATV